MSPQPDLVIDTMNLRTASDAEYAAFAKFQNVLRAETLPDDPPITLEEFIQMGRGLPPFINFSRWLARRPGSDAVIASAQVIYRETKDNRHIVEFGGGVLPEYRRQGIGRQMLACAVQVPVRENRRLMLTGTNERVPAGAAFMQRLGAHAGMADHVNQLKIEDLDRDLLREWQAHAAESASDFELGFWDGAYPEEDLEAIVELLDVMNTAPHGDLDVEDFQKTPQHLREMEESLRVRGAQRWTMYVREKSTGKFAGFTEVVWKPQRPYLLEQHGTGVFPVYRNHGLGRWLKAAMLDKVLRDRPVVTLVRTGNADTNAAMLGINNALGFKPYLSETVWQVETDKVLAYVSA